MFRFPPSSPFNNVGEEELDVFTHRNKGNVVSSEDKQVYPTPNPSSSVGKSSSPVKGDWESNQKGGLVKGTNLVVGRGDLFGTTKLVLKVPLVPSKEEIIIGRSSKACDFSLENLDRSVSREHIKVKFEHKDYLTIMCLGHNGLALRIPAKCSVFSAEEPNRYLLLSDEGTNFLDSVRKGLKKGPRTAVIDNDHTEFTVRHGESVTLKILNNILIEIRDNVIVLNPAKKMRTNFQDNLDREAPQAVESKHGFSDEETPFYSKNPESFEREKLTIGEQPFFGHTGNNFKIFEDSQDKQANEEEGKERPTIRSKTPLGDKSNTYNQFLMPKRRSKSEEPEKRGRKKKKQQQQPSFELDQNCIKSVEGIQEINNILVNHLAFSRLSSTPVSFLNSVSAITSNLTLQQIRVILHNINCIGVIYREGTDAAGEPLDEEYYYMPENDDDYERPHLVDSVRGHGGLRTCRRTHKQYYWKKPAPIRR